MLHCPRQPGIPVEVTRGIGDSPTNDPISSEALPSPGPSVLRNGNQIAVAPERIPIVSILIDRALEPLGPVLRPRLLFQGHREGKRLDLEKWYENLVGLRFQ
jgi:hypothetical protein